MLETLPGHCCNCNTGIKNQSFTRKTTAAAGVFYSQQETDTGLYIKTDTKLSPPLSALICRVNQVEEDIPSPRATNIG